MNRQRGISLIEMIFSLLLFSLLSVCVLEIIAGPVQSYIWTTRYLRDMDNLKYGLEIISRELSQAVPGSIQIQDGKSETTITFKMQDEKNELLKIEYQFWEKQGIRRTSNGKSPVFFRKIQAKVIEFGNNQSKGIIINLKSDDNLKATLSVPILFQEGT